MGKDCTDDMITSSANQQMKHLSQLMKRAKERKKEQVFVVEGIKMFQEAPADTVESLRLSACRSMICPIFCRGITRIF